MGIVNPGSPFPVTFADSVALTAFGRLSVSQAQTLFSSQQQYGDDTTVWESQTSGTGTNTFLPNESTIQMSTGGTANGASSIRQTRLYHRYTPGQGQTCFCSFVMDGGATVTNNRRRIGYFDANNGCFLEVDGSTVNLVLRTNTSGTPSDANKVAQAAWNVDPFDGTGPSGMTLDWTKAQILIIDFQWLGVGRVRVGFDIGGVFYPAHYFENANALQTKVYMTTANLPVRLENTNTGIASGTATLRHICSGITTGGGAERTAGHQFAFNTGGAGRAVTATRLPVISVRAKTTGPNSVRNTGQIKVALFDVAVIGTNPIFWELVRNPVLTGASFAALNANASIADVDSSATSLTGGTVLDAGFLPSSNQVQGNTTQLADLKDIILAYTGLLNVQDIMSLVCSAPSGNSTAFCNLTWLEQW